MLEVQRGDDEHQHEGGKNERAGRDHGAGQAAQAIAQERGAADCDRPREYLPHGHAVGEIVLCDLIGALDELLLHQPQQGHRPAKAGGADAQETRAELCQSHVCLFPQPRGAVTP